jgi:hypothetical protein
MQYCESPEASSYMNLLMEFNMKFLNKIFLSIILNLVVFISTAISQPSAPVEELHKISNKNNIGGRIIEPSSEETIEKVKWALLFISAVSAVGFAMKKKLK